jgi:hypothetical protein
MLITYVYHIINLILLSTMITPSSSASLETSPYSLKNREYGTLSTTCPPLTVNTLFLNGCVDIDMVEDITWIWCRTWGITDFYEGDAICRLWRGFGEKEYGMIIVGDVLSCIFDLLRTDISLSVGGWGMMALFRC